MEDITKDPFEEYIRMGEPDKVSVHIAEILGQKEILVI